MMHYQLSVTPPSNSFKHSTFLLLTVLAIICGLSSFAANAKPSSQGGQREDIRLIELERKAALSDNPPSAQTSTLENPESLENAEIRSGDVIYIGLPGEKTLNALFSVDRYGRITLPEVGTLFIAGLGAEVASQRVKEALGLYFRDIDGYEFEIRQRKLLVRVLGSVKAPGLVELEPGANVQQAISAAGGLKIGAQLDRFQLQRHGDISVFDFKSWLDSGNPELVPALNSLDTIFVPVSPLTGNVEIDFDAKTLTDKGDGGDAKLAIKVFGEVNRAGLYTLTENADIIEYLMRAGGVTHYAGVDQIRIITQGEPKLFNLTQYLDSGDLSTLPPIEAGATIFVPVKSEAVNSGARVAYIMGEVFKPGAYEIQDNVTFLDLLANAGGPTRYAEIRQIRLIKQGGEVIPIDLQLFTEGEGTQQLPSIGPGDAIFLPEKTAQDSNSWLKVSPNRAIHLLGAVGNPGRFEWSDEMSLIDLLSQAGGPSPKADTAKISIMPGGKDAGAEIISFDLSSYLAGKSKLPKLAGGYTVTVPQLPDDPSDNKSQWIQQLPSSSIYIFGAVGAPGRYAFNSQQGFLDLLGAADGPLSHAKLDAIQIRHRDGDIERLELFDLASYMQAGQNGRTPTIHNEDVIFVPSSENFLQKVLIIGSVGRGGEYGYKPGMQVTDLIAMAGGPDMRADNAHVRVRQVVPAGHEEHQIFDLEAWLAGNKNTTPTTLYPGAVVHVPRLPDDPNDSRARWMQLAAENAIYVFGSVGAPGRYAFKQGLSLLDILSAAQGPTGNADLHNLKITHRNVSYAKTSDINLALYFETGDRALLPSIVPGDVIYVPSRDRQWLDESIDKTVRLLGSVRTPGRYRFNSDMTILDLLAAAGGITENADVHRIRVVNKSCCDKQARQFDLVEFSATGDFEMLPVVRVGDTIYVPTRNESARKTFMDWIRDIVSVASLLALLAAL